MDTDLCIQYCPLPVFMCSDARSTGKQQIWAPVWCAPKLTQHQYNHKPDYRAQWHLQHLNLFKYINFIEAFPTRSTNIYISQLHMQNIKMAKFQRNLGLTLPSHNKWVCNCKWDCLAISELLVYLRISSLHWNQIRESRKM